ncbi:MAG TPA: hypothetical protein PL082_09505, partial [Tepidiformaceae bacterium]|nr:hypothetical protein [Tepidiformaceae bacterium]
MPTVSATVIDGGNASAAGYVIRPRRDTTLGWAATNPVLALGEIGFDTDTGEVRVGNGVNQWSDLPDGMVNAYSIAVANGFVGDEAAWLASLVGPVGPVSTTPGPQGPPGPPNALTPGTATTGAAGTSASFTITGTAPSQVLNLTIPRGPKGDPGDSQLLEPGPNRFDAATATLEFRVNHTTGALVAGAGWWASDFIPVAASSPYWTKVSWYRAYYDDSQTFISGVNVGSIIAGTTFTTPAGAAYVRDSHFEQSRIATQVVAEGSTSRPWTAYQQQVPPEIVREVTPSAVVTNPTTGATLGDALDSLAVVAGPPANAFNPATVTDGFYFNTTTGVMTAGADWHTSDFIPVTAGTVYAGSLVWWIAWFTRDQVFISGSNLTPQGAKTFTAPAGAVYARFSWFGSTAPSTIVFRTGTSAVLPPIPYTAASVDAALLKHTATLNLPATIPALVGVETNLYFDGIVGGDYALYDVDINCSIGTQQAERWTVIPAAAGTYALTFDLYRDGVG